MKKWLIGVLGAIGGSLIVAWVTGGWDPIQVFNNFFPGGSQRTEQFNKAQDLARKYYFFSNGDDPWNDPRVTGFPNNFTSSADLIYDSGTGLTWQKSGSNDSVSYPELSAYLRELNEKKFGGYKDWRLPTLAEAWSLLEHRKNKEGLHIEPIFDSKQTWIWTKTTTNDGYGWFIFFESGRPIFQNAWNSHAYIRAVRGEEFE